MSSHRSLAIAEVSVRSLRNLARVDVAPSPRLNVVSGDNGQGKTSLLEALYLACTTRSFRATRLRELVGHGAEAGSVRLRVDEGGEAREQTVGLDARGVRRVMLDGKRPATHAAYAVRTPVVVFHPGDLALSAGPAAGRRTLLDRVGLFVDPSSLDHASRWTEASRSRQRALEDRGTSAPDLDAFEHLMGLHGAALTRVRAEAARRLAAEAGPAFAAITRGAREVALAYEPGGSDDAAELTERLASTRERDRHRGSASVGPGRDDLAVALDARAARSEASQGEHRALTLALKLAELACIRHARGVEPVLLLDDVSSELDPGRTEALFGLLGAETGQIFLTTTRPDLIVAPGGGADRRLDLRLSAGAVVGASGG